MSATIVSGPKIDPSSAAMIDLTEHEPFEQYDGSPLGTRGVTLWSAGDGSVEAGVWECDAGRFPADFSGFGEHVLMHQRRIGLHRRRRRYGHHPAPWRHDGLPARVDREWSMRGAAPQNLDELARVLAVRVFLQELRGHDFRH